MKPELIFLAVVLIGVVGQLVFPNKNEFEPD